MSILNWIIAIVSLLIILAIISSIVAFWGKITGAFKNLFPGPQPIGGKCKLATDCEGWGPKDGTVCCDGICTKPGCQILGVWYCPKDCEKAREAGKAVEDTAKKAGKAVEDAAKKVTDPIKKLF